ncbi:hypothetical protein RRG08_053731 [Elysia crispata]|nr:hypothetical protein RRG08_053731 [Elysia crispata]
MKVISGGWRPQSGAGGEQAGDRSLGLREGRWDEGYISRLEISVWSRGRGGGMKVISAGWRPQSGAEGGEQAGDRSLGLGEGRWDEDYISRLETAVFGFGGRCDEDYISRLEFAVWGLEGDGMKAISAGWRPQSGVGGGEGRRLESAVWGWGEEGGIKAISAGWRPQSGAGGGRWDKGYISRLETAVWDWEGGGMKTISAGWRPQSRAGGEEGGMKAISSGWRPQSRDAGGRKVG